MNKINRAFLHTGSNLGNRFDNLWEANQEIENCVGKIINASQFYETKAWGIENQPDFINQALEVETELSPDELLNAILEIEMKLGRIRAIKWEARLIDIDILFYEEQIINTPKLIIPHPRLQERNFVLIPMMEIAPDFVHPVFQKSIESLYLESKDSLEVLMLESALAL